VAGGDSLSAYLEKALVRHWSARSGSRDVEAVSSVSGLTEGPVLMVQPAERSVRWTPIFASGSVVFKTVYASDGDLSWRDDGTVVMSFSGEPQIRIRGDLTLEDTTRGLVSRPAYERHLAERMAIHVSDALWKQLSGDH
jgi:hypothetical protein